MITGPPASRGMEASRHLLLRVKTSLLTVCVTGGIQVAFSNITLVFGMPASGQFGSQAINRVARRKYRG